MARGSPSRLRIYHPSPIFRSACRIHQFVISALSDARRSGQHYLSHKGRCEVAEGKKTSEKEAIGQRREAVFNGFTCPEQNESAPECLRHHFINMTLSDLVAKNSLLHSKNSTPIATACSLQKNFNAGCKSSVYQYPLRSYK